MTSQALLFGPYRFEPASQRLGMGEREIRLTPKAASVLGILVTRAGRPVTKKELFALAWPGTVVGDDALVSCIQELRKALGTMHANRVTSRRGIARATASSPTSRRRARPRPKSRLRLPMRARSRCCLSPT